MLIGLSLFLLGNPTTSQQGTVFNHVGYLATDTTSYVLVGRMNLDDTFHQAALLDLIKASVKEAYDRIPHEQRIEKALIKSQVRLLYNHLGA